MVGQEGEIISTGRSGIRIHGGRQESFNGEEWLPKESPELKKTDGCLRAFDVDMRSLSDITGSLTDDTPGTVRVIDDLVKKVQPASNHNKVEVDTSYVVPSDLDFTGSLMSF